ncbi:MAG: hypothetical protein M9918_25855 [Anaerolineae bacterium]|nr:hypothetical protein [Anaerolineae bacterium]
MKVNSISISSATPPTCAHCGERVVGWRIEKRADASYHTCTFTCCGQQQEWQVHEGRRRRI